MFHSETALGSALAALALACSVSRAELPAQGAPSRLSLGEVVNRVLGRSPGVAQASERVREAEAGVSEADLNRWPRLTAKSAATRGDDPVYVFSTLLGQGRLAPRHLSIDALNNPDALTNVRSSLELGVPLFTGFQLATRRELGRLQADSALAGESAAAQEARRRVLEAYLRLILDHSLIENAASRIDSAAASIEDARRLRSRGAAPGPDFYAAEAVFVALRAEKLKVQSDLRAVEAELAVLRGPAAGSLEPVGSLQEPGYSLKPLPVLIDGALRDRQDLKLASAAEFSAAALQRQESLSLLPRVDAFASVDTNTSDFGSNPVNRMIGVRAELPIGDPAYFERKAKAEASARAARAGKQSLEEAARIEVSRRYQAYQGLAAMLPDLRESADKADRSLRLLRPLYREGRQSVHDMLRAEDASLKARAGYLEALFAAHVGYARLQLAAGRLDDSVVSEIEDRLEGRP